MLAELGAKKNRNWRSEGDLPCRAAGESQPHRPDSAAVERSRPELERAKPPNVFSAAAEYTQEASQIGRYYISKSGLTTGGASYSMWCDSGSVIQRKPRRRCPTHRAQYN